LIANSTANIAENIVLAVLFAIKILASHSQIYPFAYVVILF